VRSAAVSAQPSSSLTGRPPPPAGETETGGRCGTGEKRDGGRETRTDCTSGPAGHLSLWASHTWHGDAASDGHRVTTRRTRRLQRFDLRPRDGSDPTVGAGARGAKRKKKQFHGRVTGEPFRARVSCFSSEATYIFIYSPLPPVNSVANAK
jgi:hypothetical protein